jgi:hypothetical protein
VEFYSLLQKKTIKSNIHEKIFSLIAEFTIMRNKLFRNEIEYCIGPVATASEIRHDIDESALRELNNFWSQIKSKLLPTKVVADLGSGIRPNNFIEADLLICVEPFQGYHAYLKNKYQHTNTLVVNQDALKFLENQPSSSIETIVAVDVLEHLNKQEGYKLLEQMKRVCSIQALIVTSNGYMPQHVSTQDLDEWGYEGNVYQTHLSGWELSDFDGWEVITSPKYFYENDFQWGEGALSAIYHKRETELCDAAVYVFGMEVCEGELSIDFSKKLKEFQKKSDSLFYLNLLYSPNSNKIINQNITFSDIPIRYISFSFIKRPKIFLKMFGKYLEPLTLQELGLLHAKKDIYFVHGGLSESYFSDISGVFNKKGITSKLVDLRDTAP